MNEKRGFRKTIGILIAPIIIVGLIFYIIQSTAGGRLESNNKSIGQEGPELIFDEDISGGRAILRRGGNNNDSNYVFIKDKGIRRTDIVVYDEKDDILIETRNTLLNIWKYGYVSIEDINNASEKNWDNKDEFVLDPDFYYDVEDMVLSNQIKLKEEKSNKNRSLIYVLVLIVLLWIYSAFIRGRNARKTS